MKNVIAYIRISDKDQSNFSIPGQTELLENFCTRNEYNLHKTFVDNGRSAKNFDRPDWKKLETFIKLSHKGIDYLLVCKYDRFSRNLSEALQMIELIENRYKIRILSVMEPIHVHPDSPFFFQIRTQILTNAQVEWMIIRDRTKFGNYYAAKAGRFINAAPIGYKNERDGKLSIITIDEAKAPIIRKVYEMFLQGGSLKDIHLQALRMGSKNRSKGAVKYILSNPTYGGFVKMPAYADDPGGWLQKGIHQPLIDPDAWHRVQQLLAPKVISRTVMNEEVPLRSVLRCFCGRCMTAGKSKGRKQHYWYYRCDNHTSINHNATKLHAQLEDVFTELSLKEHQVDYIKDRILSRLQLELKDQDNLIQEKKRELATLKQKLENVEEKFILDVLDADAYKKWRGRYQAEQAVCETYISNYSQPVDLLMARYEDRLPLLTNLQHWYGTADLHGKQTFVRQVFKSTLYYEKGLYRTAYLLPPFLPNVMKLKEKRLLEIEQPIVKSSKINQCAPERT